MNRLSLYLYTVRYLKPIQLFYLLRLRFLQTSLPREVSLPEVRISKKSWVNCCRSPSMFGSRTFSFLNRTEEIDLSKGWVVSGTTLLWRYNLHYFDDLNAAAAKERTQWHAQLIRSWIYDISPGADIAWDAYPTSLRIVNWIKWSLSDNELTDEFNQSLATQAHWLFRHMEFHLLANHLWSNAKALIFAGVYFAGPMADKWLKTASRLLSRQIEEQILPDGGHFERSPMYHSLILEDIVDLLQLDGLYSNILSSQLVAKLNHCMPKMFSWLNFMSHPDGEIAFFNDATIGIAANHARVSDYIRAVGLPVVNTAECRVNVLGDSGYVRADSRSASLITDVAPLGPDYQPGHGHADTLSFELSIFGQRVFVNRGIDRYDGDSGRLMQRSTRSHNTVEVDGENSSEVWGSFRVARRAKPFDLTINESDDCIQIACAHDGYLRLAGGVLHHRKWELTDSSLSVIDTLDGVFTKATARMHIHPMVDVSRVEDSFCLLKVHGKEVGIKVEGAGVQINKTTYHPGFGLAEQMDCLEFDFHDAQCSVKINW